MRASAEPSQPWRWVWLVEGWWRAYALGFKDSPAAGTVVLWIVAGDAFTQYDRDGLEKEGWTPVEVSSVRNGPVRCQSVVIDRDNPFRFSDAATSVGAGNTRAHATHVGVF